MTGESPTSAQLRVLRVLCRDERRTIREICEALRLSSTNAVAEHLGRLEKQGLLERRPGKARCLAVTAAGRRWCP